MNLSDAQIERYSRQIILPEVGGRGQQELLDSRVLVAGDGPIAETAILYLAAAGVGELHVAVANETNARRMERRIRELNEEVRTVCGSDCRPAAVDLLVDTTVDDAVRAALHASCVAQNIPLVVAEASGWTGSVAVFEPYIDDEPCVLCLPPPPRGGAAVPAVAALVGSLAAAEIVQLRVRKRDSLRGRQWRCDIDTQSFEVFRIAPRPGCRGCGRGTS